MKVPNSVTKRIDEFCESRDFSHADLKKQSPVYARLVDSNNEALKTAHTRSGGLGQKEKVLVLAGIHFTTGNEQNIEWAVSAALQVGASEAEILDAMDLALLTSGGKAVSKVQFANAVLRHRQAAGDKKDRFEFLQKAKP